MMTNSFLEEHLSNLPLIIDAKGMADISVHYLGGMGAMLEFESSMQA